MSRLLVDRHGEVVHFRLTRTLLGRARYWTGCYLVDGLLIDCGPPALAGRFARVLEGRALDGLALTHHHEDHVGAAALLQRTRGLEPRIHAAGVPLLADGFAVEAYRRWAWGRPERVRARPLDAELRTRSLRFDVVPTPGHSPDHVCLHEPERGWLFTGDLFLGERLRYLRDDEDLRELIASLRRAHALAARQVFCAHRGLLRDGALGRKLEHLETLRGRVLELLALGLPQREVARRAVGREGPLTFFSLGRFSALNFVRALAGASPTD